MRWSRSIPRVTGGHRNLLCREVSDSRKTSSFQWANLWLKTTAFVVDSDRFSGREVRTDEDAREVFLWLVLLEFSVELPKGANGEELVVADVFTVEAAELPSFRADNRRCLALSAVLAAVGGAWSPPPPALPSACDMSVTGGSARDGLASENRWPPIAPGALLAIEEAALASPTDEGSTSPSLASPTMTSR